MDFRAATYGAIISNKEHFNDNGRGLDKIIQLKKKITTRNSNKVIEKHSNEIGTEKNDRKR